MSSVLEFAPDTHMLLADILFKQGEFDDAITCYEETVRLFPTGERGHTQLAAALAAAGRFDEAITQWREAIRMVPDRWSSHLGLADAMLAAGDPATAAAECAEFSSTNRARSTRQSR